MQLYNYNLKTFLSHFISANFTAVHIVQFILRWYDNMDIKITSRRFFLAKHIFFPRKQGCRMSQIDCSMWSALIT